MAGAEDGGASGTGPVKQEGGGEREAVVKQEEGVRGARRRSTSRGAQVREASAALRARSLAKRTEKIEQELALPVRDLATVPKMLQWVATNAGNVVGHVVDVHSGTGEATLYVWTESTGALLAGMANETLVAKAAEVMGASTGGASGGEPKCRCAAAPRGARQPRRPAAGRGCSPRPWSKPRAAIAEPPARQQ